MKIEWLIETGLMINETMKRTSGQMWVNNINHIKLIIIDYKKGVGSLWQKIKV